MKRILLALAGVMAAACGVTTPEPYGEDDAALRALLPSEIVGDIAFGESKTVSYSETPRYRALHVEAAAGDVIDAWVRGADGADAVAWIVDRRSRTLASNDDADSSTPSAHVTFAVPKAGTYYVVLRDKSFEEGPFVVTLAPTSSDAGASDAGASTSDAGSAPDAASPATDAGTTASDAGRAGACDWRRFREFQFDEYDCYCASSNIGSCRVSDPNLAACQAYLEDKCADPAGHPCGPGMHPGFAGPVCPNVPNDGRGCSETENSPSLGCYCRQTCYRDR